MAEEGAADISLGGSGQINPTETEPKEKKRRYNAQRAKTRIYLYEQFVPWRELKEQLNLQNDEQLADFLIKILH